MEMNNDIMMQLMQMMQMQNQMMTQLMMTQMQQGQPAQIPTTETPTITNNDSSDIAALREELNKIKAELKETKLDLAAERQTHEATKKALEYERQSNQKELKEFFDLKKVVAKAETYLGDSIESVAAKAQELSGDDYYEENKKGWNEKKLTNKEMHDKVTAYKNLFKDEEEDDDGMVIFN